VVDQGPRPDDQDDDQGKVHRARCFCQSEARWGRREADPAPGAVTAAQDEDQIGEGENDRNGHGDPVQVLLDDRRAGKRGATEPPNMSDSLPLPLCMRMRKINAKLAKICSTTMIASARKAPLLARDRGERYQSQRMARVAAG